MKDVTSTSFGLLIGFLLPGVAGLYVFSFWSETVREWFATFLTAQSNVGLFFLLGLAALVVGLQLTLIRWLLFEKWFVGKDTLASSDFGKLKDASTLTAFRAAVDEHYRYHQFWGAMSVVLPFGIATVIHESFCAPRAVVSVALLSVSELITCFAAKEAYIRYVTRAKAIMGG